MGWWVKSTSFETNRLFLCSEETVNNNNCTYVFDMEHRSVTGRAPVTKIRSGIGTESSVRVLLQDAAAVSSKHKEKRKKKRLGVKRDTRWRYDSFFSSLSITGSEGQNIAKPKVSLNSHDARLQSCPTKFTYSTALEERH